MNYFAVGFGVVALSVVGVLDYVAQAKAAGEAPGQFSAGAYVASYGTRLGTLGGAGTTLKAGDAQSQSALARTHLPDAPEGWERRSHVRDVLAEREAFYDQMGEEDREAYEEAIGQAIGEVSDAAAKSAASKYAGEDVYEYVRGDEVIYLRVNYVPIDTTPKTARQLGLEVMAAKMVLTQRHMEGYGVIKGVPFIKLTTVRAPDPDGKLRLIALMGDEIKLQVVAYADEDSVRMLLEKIDYDGLNRMLPEPLPGVGSDAPELTREQERDMAENARDKRIQALKDREREAKVKLSEATAALEDNPAAAAASQAGIEATEAGPEGAQPSRLKLSGGHSCLEASAGIFCKN